jgi:cytochrome c biogenesis protein CcmG/thiol:disulfide interchange protein DsbE
MRFAWPLAAFVLLVIVLALGLRRDPSAVPSPLIGRPLPNFALARLDAPTARVARTDLLGRAYLLNVWASWCVACRDEHPLLVELARTGEVDVIGLNYKDEASAATAWLARHGDPYRMSLVDPDGRLGFDLGVYGVPETFVIDAEGVIRHKHIGPLTRAALAHEILPKLVTGTTR